MKIKRRYLYVVAIVCFIVCFIGLNKKYDPYYRVNGINNENRVLIDLYLDEEEKQYLIDYAISMDLFVQYIHIDGFYLPNYEYYISIDKAKCFSSLEEMVSATNEIVSRLEESEIKQVSSTLDTLISNNLVLVYYESLEFDCDNINYYQIVRSLYDDYEYSYVGYTNTYVDILTSYGYGVSADKLDDCFVTLCNNYQADSLYLLLTTTLEEGQEILINPSSLGETIDETTYIASYSPSDLDIVTGIPRLVYTTYLKSNTYNALQLMYEAILVDLGDVFLLTEGYQDYETILLEDSELAGFSVYQTGTCIDIQESGTPADEFASTELYEWMQDNAHLYGFIQEEQGSNTYRYVGVDGATEIYDLWVVEQAYLASLEEVEEIE